MARYTLERAELGSEWDAFVKSSPNGTLFSHSDYLEAIGKDVGVWFCTKGSQVKAVFACVEPTPWRAELDDLVVYNGIMHQPPEPDQNVSQVRSERFKVAEFVASELSQMYDTMAFQLHPSVVDVRPWLWVNYGLDALRHYQVDVRYTSYYVSSIIAFREFFLTGDMSQSRRQEMQYAKRDGVRTIEDYKPDLLFNWYLQTMGRQGQQVTRKFSKRLYALLSHLQERGLTRWFASYTADHRCGSIAVFGVDDKRAYWLWGANNPELRDAHTGTAVVWDAMTRLANDGVKMVDLEGCNSPNRGWFKLSFGGSLTPYFRVIYG